MKEAKRNKLTVLGRNWESIIQVQSYLANSHFSVANVCWPLDLSKLSL